MNHSLGLDNRIAALTDGVGAGIRQELREALDTLRDSKFPLAIVGVSRMLEDPNGLLDAIARAHDTVAKGDDLGKKIEYLAQKGIVPGEIASNLHWVRVYANKARHHAEKVKLTVDEAEIAIILALGVVRWFYCECDGGPRLATIAEAGEVASAHDRRGCKHLAGGDPEMARACFDEAILLAPGRSEFRTHRAAAHLARGDRARATLDVTEALRLDPGAVEAHLMLGVIGYESEDYGATIQHCDAAVSLDPDRARAYYYRGLGHLGVGDFRRARADFETAESLDPAYPVPEALSRRKVKILSRLSWLRRLRRKRR